jgi:hypothetical protein
MDIHQTVRVETGWSINGEDALDIRMAAAELVSSCPICTSLITVFTGVSLGCFVYKPHLLNADTATSTIVRISQEQHMQVATKLVMKARVFKYVRVCKVFFLCTKPRAITCRCFAKGCTNVGRLNLCTGCRAVRYCSIKCQRKSWHAHKPECLAH